MGHKEQEPAGGDGGRIAVIGMGRRLPGEVDSPGALWQLLAAGRDAVGDPPATRTEIGRTPDAASPRQGGWLISRDPARTSSGAREAVPAGAGPGLCRGRRRMRRGSRCSQPLPSALIAVAETVDGSAGLMEDFIVDVK
ncbi:beta-ketoacyl synthase N-terminal-like domain-containing protein [Streptomyces sp. NPDC001215]